MTNQSKSDYANWRRHFLIATVAENSRQYLSQYLEQLHLHQISVSKYDDFHLTMLYFKPFGVEAVELVNHFRPLMDDLRQIELKVKEIIIDQGQIWARMSKDSRLRKLHSLFAERAPHSFQVDNSDFKSWTPHIMIGRRLPKDLPNEIKTLITKPFQQNRSFKSLFFDEFYLTKENPNSFEILYETKRKQKSG